LVLGAAGAGCLQASALPQIKSELQKMRDMVACTQVIDTTGTRQATLLQGAAAQHLLAATAGVPIFGMSDLFAMDQIAGDPSGYSDLASLLQGDGNSAGITPDIENQAVADADPSADGANLDNGGESVSSNASVNVGSAYSGSTNNSAGGDVVAGSSSGSSGGSGSGGSSGSHEVASNFSEGGFSEGGGGAVTPLPAGAWAALLVIPALVVGCRSRLRRSAR
jgi:hypothetical protein